MDFRVLAAIPLLLWYYSNTSRKFYYPFLYSFHYIDFANKYSSMIWYKACILCPIIIIACSLIYYIYEYDKSIILSYYYHCYFNSYYFISQLAHRYQHLKYSNSEFPFEHIQNGARSLEENIFPVLIHFDSLFHYNSNVYTLQS